MASPCVLGVTTCKVQSEISSIVKWSVTPAEFIEFSQQVQWNRARVSAIHPRRSSVNCEAPDPEAAISIVETRARSLSIEPMVLVAEDVL